MRNIIKTTLATTFAIACISGASVAFAADNGGHNNNNGGNNTPGMGKSQMKDSDVMPADPNTTGSIKCNNNAANVQAGCTDQNGNDQQQQ